MAYGMYISAEGALAQSLRLETIANNLANVDTTGFKKDLAIFQARHAEEIARGLAPAGDGSINDVGGGVTIEQSVTDFSPGPLKNTGIDTDFAVRGRGFFVVDHGGKQMLSRAGNFQRTAEGMLITADGDPVLNEEGAPTIVNGPFQVREDGTFFTNEGAVRLAIAEPASLGDLVKVGQNLFEPLAPAGVLPDELRNVAQGFIEGSGVAAVNEMVDMIASTRAFEANVNMIRHHDQMFGTLISRVLKV
jgi:flagellar basal-body rod protein FlgF/flagellar basal-body rod protein FlgG